MPPLTLVQKRALLAALNNVNKKQRAYLKALPAYSVVDPSQRNVMRRDAAVSNLRNAGEVLYRLAQKLGLNEDAINTINHRTMSKNVISNVIKKHGFAPRLANKIWRKGHNAEMKRALANYAEFSANPRTAFLRPPVAPSPRRKTPSPQRRRTPSPARPANNAHRRIHGIGPANNTRVT